MSDLIILECNETEPETIIRDHCKQLETSTDKQRHLLITYPLTQYWLPQRPQCQLTALVNIERQSQRTRIAFTVTDNTRAINRYLAECDNTIDFPLLCQHFSLPHFYTDQPIQLHTIAIPKPWGQEIWFTGIEERGLSMAGNDGCVLPLPWVLSVCPDMLCGQHHQSLILLKILDPLPEPVKGDLYFELHEQKREVYVVTAVDKSAWPDGQGEIRFGIDQQKRRQYASDTDFRNAFLEAVKAYEVVRRQIDKQQEQITEYPGCKSAAAVSNTGLTNVQHSISKELLAKEKQLREQMESFTGRRSLAVGDVVKVPCLTPHSLQHGVRTVEFQTPVYERLIVSFAQKVLTQNHWDSARAVELMTLEPESQQHVTKSDDFYQEDGVFIERIVDFEDFDVRRVVLKEGARWFLESPGTYSLCMGVEGAAKIDEQITLLPEQAVLLTRAWAGRPIDNHSRQRIIFLLANPKQDKLIG